MMKNILLYCLFGFFFLTEICSQDVVKPNVIIFYADDLGWQDTELDYVGGKPVFAETPNLLSLAAEGAQFSQAYSPAPTCAPSRASLLSGRHPIKTKLTQVSGGRLPGLTNNQSHNKLISPFYPRRLAVEETTIAEALSPAGYVSAQIGKWHIAGANDFPLAIDQGFNEQSTSRGMHRNMGDRWTGYATDTIGDPYQIDTDGRPYDDVTEDALTFMEENKSEPFFMYMAHWLVHTPIQTRDLSLLTYYCDKLGIPVPTEDTDITTGGHTNPYYGAMIGTLDWSLGKVVNYLKATDDPRHPGKKLFETTYIIFSSDNGASEMDGDEIVTDNFPLDLGKTSAKEGGVRVPLIITGPDIPVNQFDNVVNGLDFYPTILSLTGTMVADNISDDLDGADLSSLLKEESNIVVDADGNERKDLFWHYPHGGDGTMRSSIRSGAYKLYKVYGQAGTFYEAFQLYNSNGTSNDIEEMINVIDAMPDAIKDELIAKLEMFISHDNTRFPTWNPDYSEPDAPLPNQLLVPAVTSVSYNQDTNMATATVANSSGEAAIAFASLLYKVNSAAERDEWFESLETTINGNTITAEVPEDATAIVFHMIDENNFLVLSEEFEILKVAEIVLNTVDAEQKFEPESDDVFAELLGGTRVANAYVQMTTEGGGDGYIANVRSRAGTSVECVKISFRVRSKAGDTASFDVTVGGETQSFEYMSTSDGDDVFYEFDTPITFTDEIQAMEFLVTGLINSDAGTTPRFRNYDVTFHLDLSTVGLGNLENVNDLKVFPNPVKGIFSLSEPVKSGVLYNLNGAKTFEFASQFRDINISSLDTGVYLLKVTLIDGSEKTFKILKE